MNHCDHPQIQPEAIFLPSILTCTWDLSQKHTTKPTKSSCGLGQQSLGVLPAHDRSQWSLHTNKDGSQVLHAREWWHLHGYVDWENLAHAVHRMWYSWCTKLCADKLDVLQTWQRCSHSLRRVHHCHHSHIPIFEPASDLSNKVENPE